MEDWISNHSRKSWYVLTSFENIMMFSFPYSKYRIDVAIFLDDEVWSVSQYICMYKMATLRVSLSLCFFYKRDILKYYYFL